YRTRDGWLFIMCNKEKFFGVLAEAVGKTEWITDPRFVDFAARLKHRDELTEELDTALMKETTQTWMERLGGNVPVAPVYDIAEALENPFVHEQGLIVESQHEKRGTIRTMACPIRSSGSELPSARAPQLGEHTQEVLSTLCSDADWLHSLRENK